MTNEELMKLGNAIAEGLYEGLVNNSTEVNRENDDLIRRQDALQIKVRDCYDHDGILYVPMRDVLKHLEQLPSVEPERKTGKWIVHYECPKCGEITKNFMEYCPFCGADLLEEGGE